MNASASRFLIIAVLLFLAGLLDAGASISKTRVGNFFDPAPVVTASESSQVLDTQLENWSLYDGTASGRPFGFVDGPNLYAYVVQNPWTKFDPEGLADGINIFGLYIGTDRIGLTEPYDMRHNVRWSLDSESIGRTASERWSSLSGNPAKFAQSTASGLLSGSSDGTPGGDFGANLHDGAAVASLGKNGRSGASPTPGMVTANGVVVAAPGAAAAPPLVPIIPAENLKEGGSTPGGKTASETNSESQGKVSNKRGPKTDPNAPHNSRIRTEADGLEADGNTILAGGGRAPEKAIPTPGGEKGSRRPDILYETTEGVVKGRNIGKTNADGSPVKREREALNDLNGAGVETDFVPYDR